ncbi:bifunctional DNA primase/polymerase [Streptomyces avermitilis]|uniref:bifunctional DNA primase/polymerase n=1 Tax=Streptomyces avermitilis TaxID=33903 RepID=UPI0033B68CB5
MLETPATLTVQTPSGGIHLWYRTGDTSRYVQGAGRLGWQVDVRAGWSTAVAPGTVTAAGRYRTVGHQDRPARLPRWVALELDRVGLRHRDAAAGPPRRFRLPRLAQERGPQDASAYAAAALRGEREAVASARAGRNDTINRAWFRLGQLIGAGLLEHDQVHEALTDAAAQAGIDPGEAKAQSTLRRALQAGMRAAHHPEPGSTVMNHPLTSRATLPSPAREPQPAEREPKLSQADILLHLGMDQYHLVSHDQTAYAVPVDGPPIARPLRAKGGFGGTGSLRQLLNRAYVLRTGRSPSQGCLTDAIASMDALALDADEQPVCLRIAPDPADELATWLDLGRSDGLSVLIEPGTWSVTTSPIGEGPLGRRTRLTGELPLPERDPGGWQAGLGLLRELSALAEPSWRLAVAWLLAGLRPDMLRPIAYFNGERGTAKTTSARQLLRVLDGIRAEVRNVPRSEDDGAAAMRSPSRVRRVTGTGTSPSAATGARSRAPGRWRAAAPRSGSRCPPSPGLLLEGLGGDAGQFLGLPHARTEPLPLPPASAPPPPEGAELDGHPGLSEDRPREGLRLLLDAVLAADHRQAAHGSRSRRPSPCRSFTATFPLARHPDGPPRRTPAREVCDIKRGRQRLVPDSVVTASPDGRQ